MTKGEISTVTYNTEEFLKEALKEWYDAHLIQCYMYIKHIGEDGDKDHIHLRIVPNKKLDPMVLTERLKEYTPDNKKPLGCLYWRPSDEANWILYVIHDKEYLKQKYNNKDGTYGIDHEKIPYSWEKIVYSDTYPMEEAYIRARQTLKNSTASLMQQLDSGKTVKQLIIEGADVFRAKACAQSLSMTTFETVNARLADAERELNLLRYAIINAKMEVVKIKKGDNEYYELKKINNK